MKADGQVSVPCWGSSFLYYFFCVYEGDKSGKGFPSPIGEVVSYIKWRKFTMTNFEVSVPYRGSSFLYPPSARWLCYAAKMGICG